MFIPVYETQLVRAKRVEYRAAAINSSAVAKRVILELTRPILENSTTEKFIVVSVDTKLKPIGVHVVTSGTLDASLVHPREVFQHAILANAASIFLVHNHPSGDLTPSGPDRDVTRRLKDCGQLLGIPVNDHIIVGHNDDYGWSAASLAEC
jgi:DNA repair protein RadC